MQFRSDHGQASIEHVGLVAVIALALLSAGAGAAVAGPSVLNRVTTGFQRALCTVTGEACVTLAREPCPTLRTTKTTTQGVTIASVHLGHDRVLVIERRSDGTYAISLLEGLQGGAEVESGKQSGKASSHASLSGDLGAHVGRTYSAATPAQARALVDRLRGQKLAAASALIDGAADLAGLDRADPEVSAYVLAGTGAVNALAKFGLADVVDGGVNGRLAGELGVRIAAHEREVTAYLRLDANAGVFFDALPSLVLPIEHTANGRTKTGKASASNPAGISQGKGVVGGGSIALRFGPGQRLLEVEVVGYVGGGASQKEVHARLDPADPAVQAALAGWRRAPLASDSYAALGRAAAGSAALDVRSFATTDTQGSHDHGAGIGLDGLTFAAHYGSRSKVSDLLGQSSRPVGGVWEQRLDCEAS